MAVDKINTMGCTDTFLAWLSWNLDMVGIIGLGSAIPQVWTVLIGSCHVNGNKRLRKVNS